MTQLLVRIVLVLALGFVFTGRVEAATAHCADRAAADATTFAAEPMPCHGVKETMAGNVAVHHSPAPQPAAGDPCECLAVLKACPNLAIATASTRIEPYEWVQAEAAAFVSIEPAPALRPPRA